MNSVYIHGSHSEEQERLSLLNSLLNEAYIRDIGPIAARRIVDFGSGLGHFTRLLQLHAPPGAYVVGLERDEQQISKARSVFGEVEFIQADIANLELNNALWNSFDLAHARFVLEHLPDPLRVVTYMAEAIRPGGLVILSDDDHSVMSIFPEIDGFKELWHGYAQSYILNGNDPYVGRKLVYLLSESGVRPVRNGFTFFGSCSGAPHFNDYVSNLIGVLEGARDSMIENGVTNENQFSRVVGNIRSWARSAHAAIWYPLHYAIGQKSDG